MRLPSLMELIFPSRCVFCYEFTHPRERACPDCLRDLNEVRKLDRKIPFARKTVALWYYEDHVRNSLLRFKFGRKRHYARYYGEALVSRLLQEDLPVDLITWVPVSRLRRFKRGYDQVQLIARTISKSIAIPSKRCLRKIKNNPPQSGIVGEAQKRANVLGVYRAVGMEQFQGKRVLLLDDIITTGATISECTKVLLTAGAKEVYCAAVAVARNMKK